jgi:hypothetical protein
MACRILALAALLALFPGLREVAGQNSVARGAAAGATVGALGLGTFFGLIASGLCDKAVCDGEFTHGFMVGAPMGAAGGALLGAGIGVLIPRGGDDSGGGASTSRGASSWAWHVHYGRPSGRGAGPPPASDFRVGLGYRVGPQVVVGMEVARLGFIESQRVFDPSVPLSAFADEDARSISILASGTYSLDTQDHVRLRLAAGAARSDLTSAVTVPVPVRHERTFERVSHGVHVGGGVEAGWTVTGGLHMGFEARADWISRTPMGDLPFYTLSLAVWG